MKIDPTPYFTNSWPLLLVFCTNFHISTANERPHFDESAPKPRPNSLPAPSMTPMDPDGAYARSKSYKMYKRINDEYDRQDILARQMMMVPSVNTSSSNQRPPSLRPSNHRRAKRARRSRGNSNSRYSHGNGQITYSAIENDPRMWSSVQYPPSDGGWQQVAGDWSVGTHKANADWTMSDGVDYPWTTQKNMHWPQRMC